MNTHEYEKKIYEKFHGSFMIIHVEKNLNTNCHELSVNYSKIINDYSCIFLIIHVEKEKTRMHINTHEYEKIKFMKKFMGHS